MNEPIIADTSGLFSLASDTDRNHVIAVAASEKLFKAAGTIILPHDVFTETINILGKKADHASAMGTATLFLQESTYLIVDPDEEIRQQALAKFQEQNEDVSFTDCMVMVYADRFETKRIFGFDEVFSRNGYTALIPA
jgi:predicted nucleic acid-binding protein